MKDDPREVDWAPRKIEELNDRLHRLENQTQFETSEDNDRIKAMEAAVRELQSAVASMRTQLDFMIGEGHGEPFEVWCRRKINGLAHGFEVHTRLIEQSQERLDGLDKADARKGDAVANLSTHLDHFRERLDFYENQWSRTVTEVKAGIRSLSDQGNSDRNRLNEVIGRISDLQREIIAEHEDRISALEGHPRRIMPGLRRMSEPDDGPSFIEDDPYDSMKGGVSDADEFMASLVVETAEQLNERRRVLVEAMKDRRITFDPEPSTILEPKDTESGPPAGWVRQEDGCWSSPVTVILNQVEARVRDYMANHFSTATIEGVVRAVRGKPDEGPKSTFLDRRDVNEREAAKVVGTKCPGFGQCYASDRLHWHDQYGVVHID